MTLSITAPAPTPPRESAAAPARQGAGGGTFASLLRSAGPDGVGSAPAPPTNPSDDAASPATGANATARQTANNAQAAQARANAKPASSDRPAQARPTGDGIDHSAGDGDDAVDADDSTEAAGAKAGDGAATDAVAGVAPPLPPTPPSTVAAAMAGGSAGEEGVSLRGGIRPGAAGANHRLPAQPGLAGTGDGSRAATAAAAGDTAAAPAGAASTDAAPGRDATPLLVDGAAAPVAVAHTTSAADATGTGAAPPLPAAAAAPGPDVPIAGADHPPPREAHIAAAVGDPRFAPAVGATLAVLARDGVQQARLQLHPAEMGPITVQIALDGASARVDFHAAVAATRQALEAALPALAGALRESGLTLTGGGVYQQAPGREGADSGPGGGSPDGRAPGRQASDDGPAPLMALPLRRRGLVDLVA